MSSALAVVPRAPDPEVDLDLAALRLDVPPFGKRRRGLDTRIVESVTDGELERTIEGASTLSLTVHDPKRALLQSGIFSKPIEVTLGPERFRLVQVQKQADDLTLTFEDRAVALLRQRSKPRHAKRGDVTRAQFALSLVREIKPPLPFVCPELKQRQPIVGQQAKGKLDRRKARKVLPYQFRRGGTDGTHEDSWACLQRLAEEVNWRCFVSAGAVFFISEPQLLSAKRKTLVSEQTLGVSGVDFEIDNGKVRSEVTVTARSRRWGTPPGAIVDLSGVGPADGLWLVSDVRRSLFDPEATITLKRATKKLPEPAPETREVTPKTGKHRRGDSPSGAAASKAWAAAERIDDAHLPYVWGGGHARAGSPSGGGYDCSGSTVAVLAAAGLGFRPGGPTATSGTIARSWGKSGRGTDLTVYANDVHVFIVFHTQHGDVHFGTGRWGKNWGGAGFNPQMHPTSGFTARHWPGV